MSNNQQNRGFTLLELITVIAVIGILAGMLMPALHRSRKQAHITKAKSAISQLETALENYVVDFSDYPADASASPYYTANLVDCLDNGPDDGAPNGPYMTLRVKDKDSFGNYLDPWGQPYHYHYNNGTTTPTPSLAGASNAKGFCYWIWSNGPDKVDNSGGSDDITNWK